MKGEGKLELFVPLAILLVIFALFSLLVSAASRPSGKAYFGNESGRKEIGSRFQQGVFQPLFPAKYRGDASCIIYRSGWEKTAFEWCDYNPHVIAWASEELAVPYLMKGGGYERDYYPDLLIYFGQNRTMMVEIKPRVENQNPSYQNKCKWAAARAFCREKGWQFKIWDETTIAELRKSVSYWRGTYKPDEA